MTSFKNTFHWLATHPVTPYLHTLARVYIGGMFIWSGVEKLQNLDAFYQMAHNYKVLPYFLTQVYASVLPYFEVGAGGYLVLGLFTRWAAWCINAQLLSFLIAISMVLIRGDAVDCGCFFGGEVETVTPDLLYRDLALIAVTTFVALTPFSAISVDGFLARKTLDTSESQLPEASSSEASGSESSS
jgi:uncharacterized membrane protein YphA (DoxX/SURF4 family)